MNQKELRSVIGTSITVAVMYNLGFLSLFYAIPLQLAALRGDKRFYISVSLLSSVMILTVRFVLLAAAEFSELFLLDIAVVTVVAAAMYIANYILFGYSVPVRMGMITAALGILLLAAIPFSGVVDTQFSLTLEKMSRLASSLSLAGGPDGSMAIQGATLNLMIKDMFGRSVLAVFFFFMIYTWWSSSRLFLRMVKGRKKDQNSGNWDFPEQAVWLLFIPLTLVLAERLLNQSGVFLLRGIPAYVVSNLLFIMSGLYGIRGIKIILQFIRRWNIPRQMNLLLILMLGMLIAVPGVNLILLVIVAGLGVSELWVNYRIFDKE